jgi:DNA-binding NarL/FixJ family response regulator
MRTATAEISTMGSPALVMDLMSRGLESALLLRVLDEIDYGVLLMDAQGHLRHVNHLARHELASQRLLMNRGGMLLGRTTEHSQQIQLALEQALRGQRRLLLLRAQDNELSLVFVPMSQALETEPPTVLVLLQRQSAGENVTVRMFARLQNLSSSEEAVMMGLCCGLSTSEIAQEHGVAQSTVRSQIKTLREKTGSASIRDLLRRVNSLPPMVSALRAIAPVLHNAKD